MKGASFSALGEVYFHLLCFPSPVFSPGALLGTLLSVQARLHSCYCSFAWWKSRSEIAAAALDLGISSGTTLFYGPVPIIYDAPCNFYLSTLPCSSSRKCQTPTKKKEVVFLIISPSGSRHPRTVQFFKNKIFWGDEN